MWRGGGWYEVRVSGLQAPRVCELIRPESMKAISDLMSLGPVMGPGFHRLENINSGRLNLCEIVQISSDECRINHVSDRLMLNSTGLVRISVGLKPDWCWINTD